MVCSRSDDYAGSKLAVDLSGAEAFASPALA